MFLVFFFVSQMNETFQQPGKWHDVILTPTSRAPSEPLAHIMSFTLKALNAGSVYEAIVQAKNRYGWNEVSGGLIIKSRWALTHILPSLKPNHFEWILKIV